MTEEEPSITMALKPSMGSVSDETKEQKSTGSENDNAKRSVTLLGSCDTDIAGQSYTNRHTGIEKLKLNQKLIMKAECENHHDRFAVRFFDKKGRSCAYIPRGEALKLILHCMLLQQESGKLDWLDRIEATYMGTYMGSLGKTHYVRIEFYGDVANSDQLQNAMEDFECDGFTLA